MHIYENIVIGSFLFELGARMAMIHPGLPPISVNLLQQTPDDQCLADVLLVNASICLLMEFKRKSNPSDKEEHKLAALKRGLDKSTDPEGWSSISRHVHWYIEIDEGTNKRPISRRVGADHALLPLLLRTRSL